MSNAITRFDQALVELIDSFMNLESEMDSKFGDDPETYEQAVLEAVETSIESAIEEQDSSTSFFANLLSCLSEGLETVDPSAFESEDDEASNLRSSDIDDDDDDIDDIDDDDDDDLLDIDEDGEEE